MYEVNGIKTKEYIDKLIADKGIPYIDFYISGIGHDCSLLPFFHTSLCT